MTFTVSILGKRGKKDWKVLEKKEIKWAWEPLVMQVYREQCEHIKKRVRFNPTWTSSKKFRVFLSVSYVSSLNRMRTKKLSETIVMNPNHEEE